MVRPKYKVGVMVLVPETETTGQLTGVVEAVVTREEGVSYKVKGTEEEILETDIAGAYRLIKQRESKKKSVPRKTKETKAA